jgi:hypothetical protein
MGGSRLFWPGARAGGVAELAGIFPVQVIDPEIHKLLEERPGRRRRFLDWGVFHVEPLFLATWRRYHQALQQRNAALKQARGDHDVAGPGNRSFRLTVGGWQGAEGAYLGRLAGPLREAGQAFWARGSRCCTAGVGRGAPAA